MRIPGNGNGGSHSNGIGCEAGGGAAPVQTAETELVGTAYPIARPGHLAARQAFNRELVIGVVSFAAGVGVCLWIMSVCAKRNR